MTLYRTPGDVTVRTYHAATDTFDHDFVVLVDEVDGAVSGANAVNLLPF